VVLKLVADRARRRPWVFRSMLLQPSPQLLRTPERVLFARRHQDVDQCLRHLVRVMTCQRRAVLQPRRSLLLVAFYPFVARLPADPVAPAQSCKALVRFIDLHQKTHPCIHRTDLFPGHRRHLRAWPYRKPAPVTQAPGPICHPWSRSDLLPGLPVCTLERRDRAWDRRASALERRDRAWDRRTRARHRRSRTNCRATGARAARLSPWALGAPGQPR